MSIESIIAITSERYVVYTKDYAREESVKYIPAYLAFFCSY